MSPENKCPLIDGNKRHKAFCYLAPEFVPHWKCPKKEVLLCLIYFNSICSYSEGRDDGSFSTRIAKLVASTGKVTAMTCNLYFLLGLVWSKQDTL